MIQDINGFAAACMRCAQAAIGARSSERQADALLLDALPALEWALGQFAGAQTPRATWLDPLWMYLEAFAPPAPSHVVEFMVAGKTFRVECADAAAANELATELAGAFGPANVG